MGSEVATRQSSEMANYEANPFAAAAEEMGADQGEGTYLKFHGKDGAFLYGADDDVLFDEDDMDDGKEVKMAVNMQEFRRGWVCWINEEVKEEKARRVVDGPAIREEDLPDHSAEYVDDEEDGWQEFSSVPLRDIKTGEQYLFKTSSGGGIRALGKLLKAYGKEFQKHDEDDVPLVSLGMNSYQSKIKKYGKIYNPVFDLIDFVPLAELEAALGDSKEGYEDDEEPQVDETVEEEAVEEEEKPKKKKAARKRRTL